MFYDTGDENKTSIFRAFVLALGADGALIPDLTAWGTRMKLDDEKWPFVIGLVLSLTGWQITQLVDEVRLAATVLYSTNFNHEKHLFIVDIENASTQKSVSGVRFLIQCGGGNECIDPAAEETGKIDAPPTYGAEDISKDKNAYRVKTSLAAGGALRLSAKTTGKTPPKFYLSLPLSNAPDIYILDKNTLRGWLVSNYIVILCVSFSTTFVVFVLLLLLLSRRKRVPSYRSDRNETSIPRSTIDYGYVEQSQASSTTSQAEGGQA